VPGLDARRIPRLLDTARGRAGLVVPPLVVLVLLALLIPMAVGSTVGAVLGLGVALLLIALVTFGFETTGMLLLGGGFLLAPMNNVRPSAAVPFVTASDVLFFLGVTTLLPVLMTRSIRRQAPFLIGAGGIFLMGMLTSLGAPSVFASLNGLTRLVVGALALPIVFMLWRPGRRVMIFFAAAYLLGNCLSVARGLATGITSVDGRYAGFTQHPNIMGLVSMLGLALVPFLYHELPRHRLLVLAAAAGCAGGVWFSGSRAALIAVAATVVLYLLLSRSIEHALLFFGLSIVPLYFVGQAVTATNVSESNPIGRLLGGGSAGYSDLDRENLAATAVDRFLAHPVLGAGFDGAVEAHNIYLQVAAAGGVIALVLYLVVLFATIRQPVVLGARYRLLALPVMGYALIGPITPLLWDRYIWCVLALPFLVPRPGPDDPDADVRADADAGADTATERVRG
jgi:hypothetical protein